MIDMLGSSMQKYNTGLPFSLRSSGDAVLYFSMLLVRIHTSVQEGFVFCQALIRRMYGDARRSHGAEVVRIESGLPVGFLQVVGGQSYRGEKKARATNNFSDYFVLLVDQPNTVQNLLYVLYEGPLHIKQMQRDMSRIKRSREIFFAVLAINDSQENFVRHLLANIAYLEALLCLCH